MPVFEYQCKDCSSKYEIFHKSHTSEEKIVCPVCNSLEHKKLFSSFSASVSGSYSSMPVSDCSTGSCGLPATSGCASGMCGLN